MFRSLEENFSTIDNILDIASRENWKHVTARDRATSECNKINCALQVDLKNNKFSMEDKIFVANQLEQRYVRLLELFPDNEMISIFYGFFRETKIKLGLDTKDKVYEFYREKLSLFDKENNPSSSVWILRVNFLTFCSNNDCEIDEKDKKENIIQIGERYLEEHERLNQRPKQSKRSKLSDSDRAHLLNTMAIEYAKINEDGKACKYLNDAMLADPNYAPIYSTLAHIYQKKAGQLNQRSIKGKNKAFGYNSKAEDLFKLANGLESGRFARRHSSDEVRKYFNDAKVGLIDIQDHIKKQEIKLQELRAYIKKEETGQETEQEPEQETEQEISTEPGITPQNSFSLSVAPTKKTISFTQILLEQEREKQVKEQREAAERKDRAKRAAAFGLNANSSVFFPPTASQQAVTVTRFSTSSAEFIPSSSGSTVSRELNANNTPDVVSRFGAGGK